MNSGPEPEAPPADGEGPVPAFLRSRSSGSAETVRTYRKRLARYAEWNGGPEIDRDRYDRYLDHIKRQGRRPNGIALDAAVLLLYADFLGEDTTGWQHPRSREVPTQWLRDNEYDALRRALADSRRDADDRVFAIDFLRGTGLRLNEFLKLRWADVDLEGGLVTVRSGKGGKTRTVPVPDDGPPAVRRAIEGAREAFWRRHPDLSLEEARRIRDRVSPWEHQWDVHNWLRAAARRAKLGGVEVHPHVLRHSYAVDLTLAGVPQAVVQRLLGHASPATTGRYQKVAPVDIIDALRKAGAG